MPKFQEQSLLVRTGLMFSASVGALLIGNPALAQEAPEPPEEAIQDEQGELLPEAQTAAAADEQTIVVTGTRIRQPEFTSPDPVSRIDPGIALKEGKLDTASMLQSSTIAAGSTQITSALSSNFVTAGGPGAETLDLRGLGPNRTLVLLNGRRAGPAGTRGAVSSFDLNVLPQSIVGFVDILKTGASSVYGSDAVAGVVNLVTKKDTDGLLIDANSSIPFDSGGEQYRISATYGKDFGRGHFMVAADYFKRQELARGDRRYLDCPEAYTFRPDGSRADLVDPRTGSFKCEDLRWGHVWTYDVEYLYGYRGSMHLVNGPYVGDVNLIQFQYPGTTLGIPPAVFQPGDVSQLIVPPGWFPTGYDTASLAVQNSFHPFVLEQTIVPETERKTLYADAAYEITDNIEVFGEFLFNRRKTYQNGWRQFWNFGFTGNYYNPYYGFTVSDPTAAAAGWEGWNWISATGITNQSDTSQRVDYYRGVAGLRGDFGGGGFLKGFSWDAHVQYSRSDGRYRTQQLLNDAVYEISYFQTTTCANTAGPWGPVTPISGKQCMDLPWYDPFFLAGVMTPEQIDYMFEWEEGRTRYTQLNGEFSVSGSIFELPAGPVGIALGVTARRDRIRDVPGHITMSENPFFDPTIPSDSAICNTPTALSRTLPCEQFVSNAWGSSSSTITAGKTTTTEAFGEIRVPILRDRPFFRDLSFSGGARITNVKAEHGLTDQTDKDSGNWTYKLGGNWAVNDWLRFRGTYGTSFRAPALFEQFLGQEKSFVSQRSIDPCINWALNLANNVITPQIAANCDADGIPSNHPGRGIFAEVVGVGGIGELDPETSKAWTASVILTPRFAFLPDTSISVAVDYFNIEVKGEITRLGARNILFGCYGSENFPNDPLCSLFQRGQVLTAPNNVSSVQDQFINIASQKNAGIDVTGNIRHDFGRMGRLNFLANMTWQLKDKITLLPGSEPENLNGEAGSPKWVGDFNFTWDPGGGWTIFYGLDVFSGTSDEEDVIEDLGDLCIIDTPPIIRGDFCVDVTTPAKFYHALSVTKAIGEKFEITLGMNNIFDTRPPRVSVVGNNVISMIGPVVSASQYDFYGRRMFINVSRRF